MSNRLAGLAGAWAVGVLALLAIHLLLPQRSGVIALTEVAEPFIVVSGFVGAGLALVRRARWAAVLGVILLVFVIARYGPVLVSWPSPSGIASVRVATWNVLVGDRQGERVQAGLSMIEADLVGLEEIQRDAANTLERDTALTTRYPYRVLEPDTSVGGVGLLSRYPIVEQELWSDPPLIRALVMPPGRAPLSIFVAHPLLSPIPTLAGLPVALDTSSRDADIALIRALIDREIALGRQVVVLGDFNVTEREPAYRDLSAGLRDAHLDAGIGPGLTWRPPELRDLPFGLLRIDYVLTSADLQAVSTHVECSSNSDHCLLVADLDDP